MKFVELALGISNSVGNYSSAEHGLGPKILRTNPNAEKQVFDLALKFADLTTARLVPEMIRDAQIKNLKISVGSEISCMVNPRICWVANVRTIWTHLVIKHGDNVQLADEELRLYRDSDESSKMSYAKWAAIHAELDVALTRISEQSLEVCDKMLFPPQRISYLWADAIASDLYEMYHG